MVVEPLVFLREDKSATIAALVTAPRHEDFQECLARYLLVIMRFFRFGAIRLRDSGMASRQRVFAGFLPPLGFNVFRMTAHNSPN